jgi:hypothetical protein
MKRSIVLLFGLTSCLSSGLASYDDNDTGSGVDNDVGTSPTPCAPLRSCVAGVPASYHGMSVFQVGPRKDIEQTTCPGFAPHEGSVLYGDLGDTSHTCGTCECGPAVCALPTNMEVSTAKCSDGPGEVVPFGSPEAWEGTCTDTDAPAEGGGSLTIEAPPILPCAVFEGPHADPIPPEPALMARECLVTLERGTCGEGELCAPELPPDDPLSLCLFRRGEDDPSIECPNDFPRRFVLFAEHIDHRGCTPCECGAPEGAECTALINIYTDAACADFFVAFAVSAPDPGCFDLPDGVSLGSKDAILTADIPGTCTSSGGMPSGEIETNGPMTLCCEAIYGPAR